MTCGGYQTQGDWLTVLSDLRRLTRGVNQTAWDGLTLLSDPRRLTRGVSDPRRLTRWVYQTARDWLVRCIRPKEIDSPQYHSARSHVTFPDPIKGTFQRDFRPPVFFIIRTWATDQWVKIVSILLKISQSYSNFSNDTALSQSPRSIILRGVTYDPGKSTTISEIFCTGL